MIFLWSGRLLLTIGLTAALGGLAALLGAGGRKGLVVLPPLLYLPAAAGPLCRTLGALGSAGGPGTVQFDRYSLIVELFPLVWLPVVFLMAYYWKKGREL